MGTNNIALPTVDYYRGGFPDNKSGRVIRIDFNSSDQVKSFRDVIARLASGQREAIELSEMVPMVYSSKVRSFRLRLDSQQIKDHCVRVAEEGGVASVEWTATSEAWEDSTFRLEPLVEKSGGHQYMTSGSDGAEIVAAYYK